MITRRTYPISHEDLEGRNAMNASKEIPIYRKVLETPEKATKIFMVVCEEGWRESIVCTGMYEWAADWLIGHIQGKPYADAAPIDNIEQWASDLDRAGWNKHASLSGVWVAPWGAMYRGPYKAWCVMRGIPCERPRPEGLK